MQKALGHGHPVAAFFALGFWRWYGNGAMVADLQPAVRIRRQPREQGLQAFLQRGAGAGAPHRPLQSDGQRYLLEFLAMFVLAVVHGVDQFVGKGIDGFIRGAQGRGNENVVCFICGAFSGPALSDGAAAQTSAGIAHRDFHLRNAISVRRKNFLGELRSGEQQPAFTCGVKRGCLEDFRRQRG